MIHVVSTRYDSSVIYCELVSNRLFVSTDESPNVAVKLNLGDQLVARNITYDFSLQGSNFRFGHTENATMSITLGQSPRSYRIDRHKITSIGREERLRLECTQLLNENIFHRENISPTDDNINMDLQLRQAFHHETGVPSKCTLIATDGITTHGPWRNSHDQFGDDLSQHCKLFVRSATFLVTGVWRKSATVSGGTYTWDKAYICLCKAPPSILRKMLSPLACKTFELPTEMLATTHQSESPKGSDF